jgi:phage terminase small subunit
MPRKKDKPKGLKADKMTTKQKVFAKKYIQNKFNATETAMQVYNVKNRVSAGAVGSKNLQNAKIQSEIQRLLDTAGLTKNKIFEHLNEAIISGVGRDSRNSDALRGLDMVLKLGNFYPQQQQERVTTNISVKLQTSEPEEVSKIADKLKDRLTLIDGEVIE